MPNVSERTKQRKIVVSRAYHQAFDKNKPKRSEKDYDKKLQMARAAAREAHATAAKKFDAENPRSSSTLAIADEPEHDGEEGAEEELPAAADPVVE